MVHKGIFGVCVMVFLLFPGVSVAQSDDVRIDLLTYNNGHSPSGYKAASLPSHGATVEFTALVFSGNTQISPSNYRYVWSVNGQRQLLGDTVEMNTLSFTPSFGDSLTVSVSLFDLSGNIIQTKSLNVPIARPEVYFYEKNPLRGTSHISLPNGHMFETETMVVQARPYYVVPSENALTRWLIDGQAVEGGTGKEYELTLVKQREEGNLSLNFQLQNRQQLLQSIDSTLWMEL